MANAAPRPSRWNEQEKAQNEYNNSPITVVNRAVHYDCIHLLYFLTNQFFAEPITEETP
jgi:hypothetical protein